jgi:hypothetical protein
MDIRLKKLIGTAIFVSGSAFYFLFMISVAIARLPGTAMATQLLFYFVITVIWVFFSGLLIRWMQTPPRRK